MTAFAKLQHLLLPHESNNHKARILHPSSLIKLALFLVLFQGILGLIPNRFPNVLGYASNISPSEVIRLTNEQRIAVGLTPMSANSVLDSAALAKGQDMLAKGYWAHFAPDGTSPWTFFSKFGYKYRYAGENLARDFSTPQSAVSAWMNSPTHKQNILNPNYKEIGIGVVEGRLNGVETTIIVQFFGTKQTGNAPIPVVRAEGVSSVSAEIEEVEPQVIVSPFSVTKNLSLGVVGLIILVLSLDMLIIRSGRIARIGGRTLAHLAYFGMILAVLLILKAGQII